MLSSNTIHQVAAQIKSYRMLKRLNHRILSRKTNMMSTTAASTLFSNTNLVTKRNGKAFPTSLLYAGAFGYAYIITSTMSKYSGIRKNVGAGILTT